MNLAGNCNECGSELLTWYENEDGVCERCSSMEHCLRCGCGLTTDEAVDTGICADCWTEEDEDEFV